jgi:hypothetical protein
MTFIFNISMFTFAMVADTAPLHHTKITKMSIPLES